MSLEIIQPHIEKPVSEPARLKRLPRIRVAQIAMDYLAHGWSADEICRQHPHLMPAEVHSALAYYFDHQQEIDGEIEAECREADKDRKQSASSPLRVRLRAKGLL